KNSSTALSSNEGELARSITTCVPAMASLRPSPVMLLTPVFGEAATTSWPRWRRMGAVFEPIRPVPPITTIFIPNLLEEDEVEGEPPRHGADDLFEEAHEVRAAVRPALRSPTPCRSPRRRRRRGWRCRGGCNRG